MSYLNVVMPNRDVSMLDNYVSVLDRDAVMPNSDDVVTRTKV